MLNVQRARKIEIELEELDRRIAEEHRESVGSMYLNKLLEHRLELEQRRQQFLRMEIPNG